MNNKISPSTKFLIAFSIVFIMLTVIIFIYLSGNQYEEPYTDISTEAKTQFTNTNKVTFYETDDDLNYNYISNPEIFETIDDIPYICIQSIGDKINDYLISSNYHGKVLTIIEISSNKSILTFSANISDSDSTIEGSYNYFDNTYTFFIKN